jgi:DNA-binding IclR family transcriptional regulator
MKERGYIEQSGRSGRYRLGLAFVELSSLYLNRLELKTEAEPYMRDLSQKTRQTVFLATRDRDQIVYIEKVELFDSLRKYAIIGQRKPVYATSLGKALLLGLSDDEIRTVLADTAFERLGPKTLTDIPKLIYEIQLSRERGWTMDDEEAEPGVRCVAAPVRDYRGQVVASVSTSWPIDSYPDIDIALFGSYVREATRQISIHMGYHGNV